jgi:hypothetical protein
MTTTYNIYSPLTGRYMHTMSDETKGDRQVLWNYKIDGFLIVRQVAIGFVSKLALVP